jgi:hypothetical protein
MDAKETKVIVIGASGHGTSMAVKAELLKHEVTIIDIMDVNCKLTDSEKRYMQTLADSLTPEPYLMEMIPEMECSCYADDYKKENVKFYDHYYKKSKKHKK